MVIGFQLFREKIQEVNAELDKMAEENGKPATNRMNALREATVHAAEGLNNLEMKLAAAARSEQNMRDATDKTITDVQESDPGGGLAGGGAARIMIWHGSRRHMRRAWPQRKNTPLGGWRLSRAIWKRSASCKSARK